MMVKQIDLGELTDGGLVPNLSGRHRGLAARDKYNLKWSGADDVINIEVLVPTNVDSVTPSFVQGMFGQTLRALSLDEEAFFNHVHFRATPNILEQIKIGVLALRTSNDLGDVFN